MAEKTILTKQAHKGLIELLEHLKRDHRNELNERLKKVQRTADPMEDQEYEELKKEYQMLESRIAAIEHLLTHSKILDETEIPTDTVGIGSRVKLQNLKTKEIESYTLLSTIEADPFENKISNLSPVGRAIIGQKVGSLVTAHTPNGNVKYLILEILK